MNISTIEQTRDTLYIRTSALVLARYYPVKLQIPQSVYLSILSVYLFIYLSVLSLSICLFICLSYLFAYLSIYLSIYLSVCRVSFICLSYLSVYLCICLSVCRVSEEECDEDFLPSPMSRYRQLLFASLKFCLAILTSLGIENQDCGNQVSRLGCQTTWHEKTDLSHICILNILLYFSLKCLKSCILIEMSTHDEDFIYFKNDFKSFITMNFKWWLL